jgi:hypothetical protein
VIARGDDPLVVDDGDREEIVEDSDLSLAKARREIDDVAARLEDAEGEDGGGGECGACLRHEKQTPLVERRSAAQVAVRRGPAF